MIHELAVAMTKGLRRPAIRIGVAVVVCAGALLVTANRVRPFVDDVTEATSAGDDWLTYKQNAVDILDHGLTIPRVQGAYYQPSGFLYNYFVAAIFAVAGRIPAYVYVVQGAFVGLTVFLYFLIGRRVLRPTM